MHVIFHQYTQMPEILLDHRMIRVYSLSFGEHKMSKNITRRQVIKIVSGVALLPLQLVVLSLNQAKMLFLPMAWQVVIQTKAVS